MPRKPPPKKAPARALPETPSILCVGGHGIPEGSTSVYEVTCVSQDGRSADLCLPGTNLERFRVPTASLIFVKLERARCSPAVSGILL